MWGCPEPVLGKAKEAANPLPGGSDEDEVRHVTASHPSLASVHPARAAGFRRVMEAAVNRRQEGACRQQGAAS